MSNIVTIKHGTSSPENKLDDYEFGFHDTSEILYLKIPTKLLALNALASSTTNGLLSSIDKEKLDSIQEGATKNSPSDQIPLANGEASTGEDINFARGDHVHPLQKNISGNAETATKATQDKLGQDITSYVKTVSLEGKTLTIKNGGGIPQVFTTQDTTYSDFIKSGSSAKSGLVPAPPSIAGTSKYLREDGTWEKPPDTTYTTVTSYNNPTMKSGWTKNGGGWYRIGNEVHVQMSVSKSSAISNNVNDRDIICSGLPTPVYAANAPVYHVKTTTTSLLGVVRINSSGQLDIAVSGTSTNNYACWFNFTYLTVD